MIDAIFIRERERVESLCYLSQVYLCRYNVLGTTRSAMAVCDPVVIRYYSCPPIALVLPIPLAFGVCRCHITVYDCVQLNIGCNDLLTVFSCRPDEPVYVCGRSCRTVAVFSLCGEGGETTL